MTKQQNKVTCEVRTRLVEVAGRTTQDLGMGRIIGQVLGDIYMTEGDSSLDDIGRNLGLSKAAVSIAARSWRAWDCSSESGRRAIEGIITG